VLVSGGYLVVLFRPDVWNKDDIYGYRAALNSPHWRQISGMDTGQLSLSKDPKIGSLIWNKGSAMD
jgi:hypothetical protein